MINYSHSSGLLFPKAQPRVLDRIDRKAALAKTERDCRKAVDARDKHRCFFPGCKARATDKHHLVSRSARGKTIWQTWDILSACREHHNFFKAGLIRTEGNPDVAPVRVFLTALGVAAKLRLPGRAA